jgi:hypothetical protein
MERDRITADAEAVTKMKREAGKMHIIKRDDGKYFSGWWNAEPIFKSNESHTAFPYKELADVTRQVQKLSEYGFATCILNVPDEIDCEF